MKLHEKSSPHKGRAKLVNDISVSHVLFRCTHNVY